MPEEASEYERDLIDYLRSYDEKGRLWPRVNCFSCGAPSTLYCVDCCRVVIQQECWPEALQSKDFRLPFEVDLVFDDVRAASTGLQAAAVLNINAGSDRVRFRVHERQDDGEFELPDLMNKDEKVFLLFPGPGSKPLSSVLVEEGGIDRLVVLDCKWTKSFVRTHPKLNGVSKVHLDIVPQSSYYWRWHSKGKGMVSTSEAIYYAARQVATYRNWEEKRQKELLNLLWLFAIQRSIIRQKYESGNVRTKVSRDLPFSEDAKQYHRGLRGSHKMKQQRPGAGAGA